MHVMRNRQGVEQWIVGLCGMLTWRKARRQRRGQHLCSVRGRQILWPGCRRMHVLRERSVPRQKGTSRVYLLWSWDIQFQVGTNASHAMQQLSSRAVQRRERIDIIEAV